jgi:hypothetical protein
MQRKSSRRNRHYTLAAALDDLPDRFREAEVSTNDVLMVGLKDYMRDLADHMEAQTGRRDQVVEAMTALGSPPSEWYRAALQGRP